MNHFNILTRRAFLDRSFKIGLGVALATLADIPFVMKRALAEGNIGLNGKKVLFIFLRGANDSLNSLIPIVDSAYNSTNRPSILIPKDTSLGYDYTTAGLFDPTQYLDVGGTSRLATSPTFSYSKAISLGNGFAALHPSLKFLAPVYSAGQLALIHRVAYPKQSRSHFDSQNYWENGLPNDNVNKEGVFYRTLIESGLAQTAPLTGVSIQSALPLILRGSAAAMTNLSDPTRYNLFGIPNTTAGNNKTDQFLNGANNYPFPDKKNRALLGLQYQNLSNTLNVFSGIDFTEGNGVNTGNYFKDAQVASGEGTVTDGDAPYYLFPTSNSKNGGYSLHNNDTSKYVVDTGAYSLFTNLKAASLILNQTDAIIAGTEYSGFDTHNVQGSVTGSHANLMRRLGWAMYSLRKYFMIYGKGGTNPMPGAKVGWNDIVVVTLSEFGRTTVENGSAGTDHAEAGAMFVAGGGITGGVYGCSPADTYNGNSVPWATGQTGSMFGVSSRYLQRAIDYRSVLGRVIRNHLGATQNQLNRIIPGYATAGENLQTGGISGVDGVKIAGEIPIV
ncbi:MAG: DUF1501 domain-containing protein [Verrucomicrobiae bacterium]